VPLVDSTASSRKTRSSRKATTSSRNDEVLVLLLREDQEVGAAGRDLDGVDREQHRAQVAQGHRLVEPPLGVPERLRDEPRVDVGRAVDRRRGQRQGAPLDRCVVAAGAEEGRGGQTGENEGS